MSTLTRNDGVEFVMQAYRELVENGNKTATAQKVRALSDQHGRFVRLFKKESGIYEGVFSHEAGYLLGESVKHYFYQAQNLIFCETYDAERLLVVIVRDGVVYLDNVIPKDNLAQELRLLITDSHQYQIFTHGNVPLKQNNPIFPNEKIISFEKISNALFPRLPTIKSLQLLPLPTALKAQHLHNNGSTITYIAIIIIAVAGGWMILDATNELQHYRQPIPKLQNLYQSYETALQSPAANTMLRDLMQTIDSLYAIPGFKAVSIDFSQQQYTIRLNDTGGGLSALTQWCNQHGFDLQLDNSQPILIKSAIVPNREAPHPISASNTVLDYLTDQLNPLIGASHIRIGAVETFSATQRIPVTLEIQQATPKLLDIIGQLIQNQPLVVNSAHFELNGITISGQIQLSVWGS